MNNANSPAMPVVMLTEESQYNGMKYVEAKEIYQGFTKREMFAMAAMQGLSSESSRYYSAKDMAYDAVKLADALLSRLEETK